MSRGVRVNASGVDGIDVVRYGTWFPYRIKFHASRLFDTAMRRQADLICKALGGPPDLIWDFDNTGQFADLRSFRAKQSLFHLVDAPSRSSVGTKHADKLATLAPAFMIKSGHPANVPVVGHGLAQVHANLARQRLRDGLSALGTDVAMVGNLGAVWIDWPVIAAMVSRLPDRKFRLIGPLPKGPPPPALASLYRAPNCLFTGPLPPDQVAALGDRVAVWLIAFNNLVQGGPTDTHKMLEYLATGAPVLTSWLANWADSDLVTMAANGNNGAMPEMLEQMHLKVQPERLRHRRIETALAASYATRLDEIEAILAGIAA